MAAKRVAGEQYDIYRQHQAADADAEAVGKPIRLQRVPCQDQDEDKSEIQEVPVDVLNLERPAAFPTVVLVGRAKDASRGADAAALQGGKPQATKDSEHPPVLLVSRSCLHPDPGMGRA